MSTHYTRPDAGDARAPFPIVSHDVTRYRSAAEICAAINAAAADAPEFSDACYAPGAADWHGPTRGASFAHFLYCIDGARGSYSVSNTRENLLTLARKVNTIRAAFDGKPRRAPAAKRAPTSAPHVAARALLTDENARDAIQLAENSGAVFFGAAAVGAPGVPYMGCETVELFGHSFTIGRAIKTGRFLVLHTSTALSVSGSAHRDGFKTHSAAVDWIETESACDAWREKFLTALHGRSAFDQTAARARYFEDETAPVDTIEPAPVESDPAETAPDAPIEQPAPVEAWPPLQPMMRPAERIARLPLFARLAIERIDADSDLRTGAKLDELLRAYAAQYRETCDDYTRQSAHAIASRRFWNFRPDDAPIAPAAIVPAADPAPVCEPVESPALQATRAHQWMTHAARRVYWVHCETARFSRELGPLPFGSMFRRPRSPGFMPDFLAPEIRAHRAAVAAAVRADRAAKRAPADAPRADAAPVDTGAAPGGWMRPAAGMLSESEARAWPSAEPVESAPTPGYAFPADALPATHSDAAEPAPADRMAAAKFARQSAILEKLIRCDGQVMTRRAFLHSKIRDGLRLTVEQHDRIAPMSRMRFFRAGNEQQREHEAKIKAAGKKDVFFIGGFEITKTEFDYAAEILASMAPAADPAPVPGDSDPVPVNSAAPVDPDEQQTGETVETWFERIRRESAEKRARIAELADTVAAGSGSIGFMHPSDPARYGIAGPDMSGRGAFRFTYFDAAGPIGDAIRPSLADAIAAGIEYGFTVDAAPLEWPENPEPDAAPVPVPVNSADVDAVEIARLVAKFRQFADERRRTGDTLAAAIRVESAEARYRADSLTAPNAFRDAPGAGHEAAKAHDSRRAAEYRAAAVRLDAIAAETEAAAVTGFPVERPDRVSTTAAVDMRGPVYRAHVKTAAKARELEGLPAFRPGAYTVNADLAGGPFESFRLLRQYRAPAGNELRRRTAAAVRADRAAKRAPADAPRADAAPVDTGAAPGGWMRPAAGMLSESEARAWPSAEPVESAPTPGYAFPADALPATHSDAAEPAPADRMAAAKFARQSAILEKLIRCDGQVMTRRAFLHSKIRDGLRLTVEQHDRIAPMSRMRFFRAGNEQQREHEAKIKAAGKKDVFFIGGFEITKTEFDYAAEILASMAPAADPAPVPGDSDPVPVNSAAPVDPDEQQTGETVETWFERIRRESAEKRARIAELADTVAAGSGSIGFMHPSDPARYGIAGPDMSGRGAFRFTYFDAAGPIGDAIRPSLADAIAAGVEYGFTVDAAPLEWPENPEPDAAPAPVPAPVPVPVPGKFETFASLSDVDLRRYIEGCHIARQFGIDFEHAAQELNDRKERGTWSNPGAPVATHTAPHPVPADTAPDDDTTPAPLDGLDVIETADAETLAEFDRLSRAPGVAPPATDARPIPSGPVLRIPAGDLRARIPARFAPAYLLTA